MEVNVEQMRLEEQKKNVVVAYLLWWFLGFLGAHRFYIKKSKAVVMLTISILSALTIAFLVGYVGLLVMFVWWIMDGIRLHKWVEEYNLQLIDNYENSKKSELTNTSKR